MNQIQNLLFITFLLKKQNKEFDVCCRGCREIILPDYKKPVHVKGFIELDGKYIPVVDPGIHFRGEPTVPTNSTCILVVEHGFEYRTLKTGILVKDIDEVMNLVVGGYPSTALKMPAFNVRFILELSKNHLADEFLADCHITLNLCEKQKYMEDDYYTFKEIKSRGLVYA